MEVVMIGQRFGKLTVLELTNEIKCSQKTYLCLCDCGNKKIVIKGNLKKGNSTSCGCSRAKTCSARMALLNLRHGETDTKLWRSWKGIVERTTSVKSSHYPRYGAVGIGIFKDWLKYENFANYIGQPPSEKHSVDRIDNSKGYEPNNVRWATAKEQAHNRKTNIFVDVDGNKMILSDAAKLLKISRSTASRWYKTGKIKKYEPKEKTI